MLKKVLSKPSGPPKPPEPKQTPEESTAIIKGLLTTNNAAALSSWVSERSSGIDARINELSNTVRATGATSIIGHDSSLQNVSLSVVNTPQLSTETGTTQVPIVMSTLSSSTSSSRFFSPYGLTSLAVPLSFLTTQRKTKVVEEEESKKKSDAELTTLQEAVTVTTVTSGIAPVTETKNNISESTKADSAEAAVAAAREAVEKAKAAAAAAPPVDVQWGITSSTSSIPSSSSTTIHSSPSTTVSSSSNSTSVIVPSTTVVANTPPSIPSSSNSNLSSTTSSVTASLPIIVPVQASTNGPIVVNSSNQSFVPVSASQSQQAMMSTSSISNTGSLDPLHHPQQVPQAPSSNINISGGTSSNNSQHTSGGKPPSRPPSRAGASSSSSSSSAAGSRRPSTASTSAPKQPQAMNSTPARNTNDKTGKTNSSTPHSTATKATTSSSSKPSTSSIKQPSSSSTTKPTSSTTNSRPTSPSKSSTTNTANDNTIPSDKAINSEKNNDSSSTAQGQQPQSQSQPPQQMNMMVPFMVPIPVMITMGPNGPMATALPPPAGGYTTAGAGPSLPSLPSSSSSSQPQSYPTSDSTMTTSGAPSSSATLSTPAAEREVSLLLRVKDLLAQNDALKSELSGLDKSFFDEIEDLKFELAERKKKDETATLEKKEEVGNTSNEVSKTIIDTTSKKKDSSTTGSRSTSPTKDKDKPKDNSKTKSSNSPIKSSSSPGKTSSSSIALIKQPTINNNEDKQNGTKPKQATEEVEGRSGNAVPASSLTSAHVEQGLTVLRKRFNTRWEEGEASALGDVSRSIIGFPLGPDGLPMPTSGITSTSPTRKKTMSGTSTSLLNTSLTSASSTSSSSTLPGSKVQQTLSTPILQPHSESLRELRSAWNQVAFGPRLTSSSSSQSQQNTSNVSSTTRIATTPPLPVTLPLSSLPSSSSLATSTLVESKPISSKLIGEITPSPILSFNPPRSNSAFIPNISSRKNVSATVAAAKDTVDSADELIKAVNAVITNSDPKKTKEPEKNESMIVSLSVEDAIKMTIEAIDECKPSLEAKSIIDAVVPVSVAAIETINTDTEKIQPIDTKSLSKSLSQTHLLINPLENTTVSKLFIDDLGSNSKSTFQEHNIENQGSTIIKEEILKSTLDNEQLITDGKLHALPVLKKEAQDSFLSNTPQMPLASTVSQSIIAPTPLVPTGAITPATISAQENPSSLQSLLQKNVTPSAPTLPLPLPVPSDAEKRAADAAREAAEAAAAMQQFLLDMSQAEAEADSVAGDGVETTQEVFPHATEEDYLIRVLARNALAVRIKHAMESGTNTNDIDDNDEEDKGFVHSDEQLQTKIQTQNQSQPLLASHTYPRRFVLPVPGSPAVDLLGSLSRKAKKALEQAFSRFDERHQHPQSSTRPKYVASISKVKELQMSAITSYDFERGLLSLGLHLSPDEIAALVGGLRLDVHGMINYSTFVRFVALPLVSKPEDADTLIASVIQPPLPSQHTSLDRKKTSDTGSFSFTGVTEEAASFAIKVPRPVHAEPSPIYRERFCPPSPRHVQKYERKIPPPPKMNSAWAYADAESARKRPRVHVPWPCLDLNNSHSAFWSGVNKLEQQMLREVRLRAEVKAAMIKGSEDGTSHSESNSGPGTIDLRRSYLFFDRRGKRALQVEDLHETLADLGLIDRMPRLLSWGAELEPIQPVQPKIKTAIVGPPKGEDDPHSWSFIDVEDDGRIPSASRVNETTETPQSSDTNGEESSRLQLIGLSSPSRRTAVDAPRVLSSRAEIVNDANSRDAIASLGDPLAADLANGARAMVIALFNRIHGASDPGNTGVDLGPGDTGRSLILDAKEGGNRLAGVPITFNVFARWAAPLNTNLRRLREKVQSMFLAQATVGGGGKDFDRAFRRIDKNGDGNMSLPEFREVLGPLLKALSPSEMQNLCDYFDTDGSGEIDFKEFLGMTSERAAQELAIELDDDEPL
jgi:hypothetical protein